MNKKFSIPLIILVIILAVYAGSLYYTRHVGLTTPTQTAVVTAPIIFGACDASNTYNTLAAAQAEPTNVCQLDLQGQKLASTSIDFTKFVSIKTLNVSFNNLGNVPSLSGLSQLTSLNLSNNQIMQLPPSLATFAKLSSLDVSHNNLIEVPVEFSTLSNLKQLNVAYNKLTTVPSVIASLTGLSTLLIGNNPITTLPESTLKALPNLTLVAIQNTKLPASTISTLKKDFPKITFIIK